MSKKLLEIDGIKIYGEKANRTSVVSFNLEGIGIASDVGMILDKLGIAVSNGAIIVLNLHYGILQDCRNHKSEFLRFTIL